MLKLPKNVLELPNLPALEAFFRSKVVALPGHDRTVSVWALTAGLGAALKVAFGTGHLVQGLELIAKELDKEAKGIRAVQEKSGQPPANRLSRLVFLANDGAERFYHDAASMLDRHADRAWGCVIDASAADLGKAFTAKGGPAKALMINDKAALGHFLKKLAEHL